MNFFRKIVEAWRQDRLLGTVIKNTGYLFSSNSIGSVVTSIQGLMAAALLGPAGYGTLGLIVAFASNVNQLLSFRMGEVIMRYAGQYLAVGKREKAAVAIKIAGITEALASILAYLLLVLIAPWGAAWFIKDPAAAPWIALYGVALLLNLMTETSTAVLQLANQFRSQAILNLLQSLLTAFLIFIAFITRAGVYFVLLAYLAGKAVSGLGVMYLASRELKPLLGSNWWKVPIRFPLNMPGIAGFAISTNLSGTVNLLIRNSEILWVGLFFSPVEAGYFKFAQPVVTTLMMPVTPFISTTFPEITRSVARRAWRQLRSLLSRTTILVFAWTTACGLGVLVGGPWLLSWFKRGAYLPSLPAILILLAGYGFANIFFWNRPLLLAFGKPNNPLAITAGVGAVKTILMLMLWVPQHTQTIVRVPWLAWTAQILAPLSAATWLDGLRSFGYLTQAGLLSAYFVLSVGLIVRSGWLELRAAEAGETGTPSQPPPNFQEQILGEE